jgi:hypothetical protein
LDGQSLQQSSRRPVTPPIALVIIAIGAKVIGCALFARGFGFNAQQSLRVGIGMISRGEVGLIGVPTSPACAGHRRGDDRARASFVPERFDWIEA